MCCPRVTQLVRWLWTGVRYASIEDERWSSRCQSMLCHEIKRLFRFKSDETYKRSHRDAVRRSTVKILEVADAYMENKHSGLAEECRHYIPARLTMCRLLRATVHRIWECHLHRPSGYEAIDWAPFAA
jgi:hypothetical protein